MTDDVSSKAGEYVLGTASAEERAAFEQMMASDPRACAHMREWERRLLPLIDGIAPVKPPAALWRRVVDAVDAPQGGSGATVLQFKRAAARWRAATAATGLIAACLAGVLAIRPSPQVETPQTAVAPIVASPSAGEGATAVVSAPSVEGPRAVVASSPRESSGVVALGSGVRDLKPANRPQGELIAALNHPGQPPGLIVRLDTATGALAVRLVGATIQPERILFLWAIPDRGAPKLLGTMVGRAARLSLPAGISPEAVTIGASIEPNSPERPASPTGDFVYLGKFVAD